MFEKPETYIGIMCLLQLCKHLQKSSLLGDRDRSLGFPTIRDFSFSLLETLQKYKGTLSWDTLYMKMIVYCLFF